MSYIKILLLSLFPVIIFGQGYYYYQTSNAIFQLSLNDDKTFIYSEESPIGNLTVYVSGTFNWSDKSKIIGNGWDSQSNTKVELIIYLKDGKARIFIYGNERSLSPPSKK